LKKRIKKEPIPKTRCSGRMSEAQFTTFVKNQLRGASWKWAPISEVFTAARVGRGVYRCNKCENNVPLKVVVNGKRIKNVFVDHILPVVDPDIGWVDWDSFINRLYCEREGLQVLCGQCHDEKTTEEKSVATERRRKDKEVIDT
jgi:hypothetical protein